jgi:hypothetical protein
MGKASMQAAPEMSPSADLDISASPRSNHDHRTLAWVRVFPLGGRHKHFWAISRDITGGGLVVVTSRHVPLNTSLVIDMFPSLNPSLRVRARVVRHVGDVGFACVFTSISRSTSDRLAQWLGRCGGLPAVAGTISP